MSDDDTAFCRDCGGTGDGPRKDRHGEAEPCPRCNGSGRVAEIEPARTAMKNGVELSMVHYLISGGTPTSAPDAFTVQLCPVTRGSNAYDLSAALKVPDMKCIVHFSPYSKSPATGLSFTVRDGGWFVPPADDALRWAARIIKFRETGV